MHFYLQKKGNWQKLTDGKDDVRLNDELATAAAVNVADALVGAVQQRRATNVAPHLTGGHRKDD